MTERSLKEPEQVRYCDIVLCTAREKEKERERGVYIHIYI